MADELSPEVEQLRQVFEEIGNLDVRKDLVRTADLGAAANFSKSQSLFEAVIRYAARLRDLPWQDLPQQLLTQTKSLVDNLRAALQAVQAFDLEEGNATARRDGVATAVQARYDELRTTTYPFVAFLAYETLDFPEMQRQITETLEEAKAKSAEIVDTATKALEQKQAEADGIVVAMRAASAERGVGTYADAFGDAAKSHEKGAVTWLRYSLAMAAITIGGTFALVRLWEANGDVSDASVLQIVLAKGTFLAIMAFVTLSFFRIYRSHTHMAETNRHRERAMRTFQTFTAATDDPDTKNQVLLEATHAVFGHTSTGLIDGRENTVTELLDAGAKTMLRRNP